MLGINLSVWLDYQERFFKMFDDICRVCEDPNDLRDIFDENAKLALKIISCAGVSVEPDDHLSRFICGSCKYNLEIAYQFKKQCEFTDYKWRILSQIKAINNDQEDDLTTIDNGTIVAPQIFEEIETTEEYLKTIKNGHIIEEKGLIIFENKVIGEQNTETEMDPLLSLYIGIGKGEEVSEQGINEDCLNYRTDIESDDCIANLEDIIIEEYLGSDSENQDYEEEQLSTVETVETLETNDEECERKKLSKEMDDCGQLYHANEKIPDTKGGKQFQCDTCKETFSSYSKFNIHKKTHGKQRYQCPICQKWFSSCYRLKSHQAIHDKHKKFICDKCGNKYSNQGNLDRHIRHNHWKEKPYVCTECGVSFSRSSVFAIHQSVHTKERNYVCGICEKRFKSTYYLKLHQKIHVCSDLQKPKKKRKLKSKQNDKIKCEVCGKISTSKYLHLSHMRTHTGEKPFECKVCGKKFAFRPSLRAHEFMHTGEKPYKCKLCGACFRQFGHLKGHLMVHSGEKNHKCIYCDKQFILKSNLVVHERIHTVKRFTNVKCALNNSPS